MIHLKMRPQCALLVDGPTVVGNNIETVWVILFHEARVAQRCTWVRGQTPPHESGLGGGEGGGCCMRKR